MVCASMQPYIRTVKGPGDRPAGDGVWYRINGDIASASPAITIADLRTTVAHQALAKAAQALTQWDAAFVTYRAAVTRWTMHTAQCAIAMRSTQIQQLLPFSVIYSESHDSSQRKARAAGRSA